MNDELQSELAQLVRLIRKGIVICFKIAIVLFVLAVIVMMYNN